MTSNGTQAVAVVSYVFLVLTWLAVLLRCYVRIRLVNLFGIDDFLMVGALPVFTLFCLFAIFSTYHGTGSHADTLSPEEVRHGLMLWKGGELSYVISSAVAKLSVGFFLLRVTVRKIHRQILCIAMIVTTFCGVVFFFILLLQCVPVSFFWNRITDSEKGRCMPNLLVMGGSFAYMTVGGICDFIFGLLPIWIVWPLSSNRGTKVALSLILGLGALAGGATIIRMPYVRQFAYSYDFLWITRYIVFWSLVEVGLGITAGSLATTRPLYRRIFKTPNIDKMDFACAAVPSNDEDENRQRPGWTTWQMEITTRDDAVSLDVEMDSSGSERARLNPGKGGSKRANVVVSIKEISTCGIGKNVLEQPEPAYRRS